MGKLYDGSWNESSRPRTLDEFMGDTGGYVNDSQNPTPADLSYIQMALEDLSRVLKNKNADYRPDDYEFSNFSFAAKVSGIDIQGIMLAQIGIKLGRIKGLLNGLNGDVSFESLDDSIKDLAGYAVILYAYRRSLV